jgi:hypothetical protein
MTSNSNTQPQPPEHNCVIAGWITTPSFHAPIFKETDKLLHTNWRGEPWRAATDAEFEANQMCWFCGGALSVGDHTHCADDA